MSMSKITPGSVFQRSPNATHQTVAGEAIIIDLNSGQYFSLNETGSWFWEHLDGQATVSQLAHDLAAICNIPDQVDTVQRDLLELLENLVKARLVDPV